MKPRIQLADSVRFKHDRALGYHWFCSDGMHHAVGPTPSLAYRRWALQKAWWEGASAGPTDPARACAFAEAT